MATDEELDNLAGEAAAKTLIRQASPLKKFTDTYVKPAALPTALSIIGGMAGATAGPWGAIAGSSVGSGIGEGINQLTGITEPNLSKVSEAMFWPAAVGGALQTAKAAMPMLTSGRAATTLNALAPEEAAARVGAMTPKVKASVLFQQATQSAVQIPMNRTVSMLDDMIDDLGSSELAKSSRRPVVSALTRFKDKLMQSGGKLTPSQLQAELEGSGEIVSKLQSAGGKSSGASKQLYKALTEDLDDAIKTASPASAPAQLLKAARDTFKKESVLKELGESIDDATKVLRGQGEKVQFNAAAVLNAIKKNPFYEDALSAVEKKEISSLLKTLNKIPALAPGAGQQYGSGQIQSMLRMTGIGAGVGAMSGGGPGAAIGSAVGLAVQPVAEFGKNMATALSMTTGRALMKELLTRSGGNVTPQVASVLAAYAHAVNAGQVAE